MSDAHVVTDTNNCCLHRIAQNTIIYQGGAAILIHENYLNRVSIATTVYIPPAGPKERNWANFELTSWQRVVYIMLTLRLEFRECNTNGLYRSFSR